MQKWAAAVAAAFSAALLSGCVVGGDDKGSAPTIAIFTVTPVDPATFAFRFDGSGSSGDIRTYEWAFGDATEAEGKVVDHSYQYGDGVYKATLTVTDAAGGFSKKTLDVTVGTGVNDAPTALFTPSTRVAGIGAEVTFDAGASSDPEGDPLVFAWDFNYLIAHEDYLVFREEKRASRNESEGSGGSSAAMGAARELPDLPSIPTVGAHGGGPGGAQEKRDYVTDANKETSTARANYSFPMEADYYVYLKVLDVKGKADLTVSEEIWPVRIVAAPPSTEFLESGAGNLTAGPAGQNAQTDEETLGPYYEDNATATVTLNYPLKSYRFHVSWSQGTLAPAPGLANDIAVRLTHPDDRVRTSPPNQVDPNNEIVLEETSEEIELPAGDYLIEMWSTTGLGANGAEGTVPAVEQQKFVYTWSFEAELDTNPFREVEQPPATGDESGGSTGGGTATTTTTTTTTPTAAPGRSPAHASEPVPSTAPRP